MRQSAKIWAPEIDQRFAALLENRKPGDLSSRVAVFEAIQKRPKTMGLKTTQQVVALLAEAWPEQFPMKEWLVVKAMNLSLLDEVPAADKELVDAFDLHFLAKLNEPKTYILDHFNNRDIARHGKANFQKSSHNATIHQQSNQVIIIGIAFPEDRVESTAHCNPTARFY